MRFLPLLLCVFLAAPAAAEVWGPPTDEYSAVLTFVDRGRESLIHRIHYTTRRQRLDYKAGEREESVIVDAEAGAVFVLYPQLKRYRKSPLVEPDFDFGIARADTKRERLADESTAGVPAVKYRVETTMVRGQSFKGFAWLTAERILVRLEGDLTQGRRTRRITMSASELKVGKVDPVVFRVPEDYAPIEPKRP